MILANNCFLPGMKSWFNDYYSSFHTDDPDIQQNFVLKKEHTFFVCENASNLSDWLGLDAHDKDIAEISALFHDLGRFEQYQKYKTFLDARSVNHACLALDILEREKVLSILNEQDKNYICKAIAYHNRASIPPDEDEKTLLFSKILRDADKLDIWRIVTDYYNDKNTVKNTAIEYNKPDTIGFSPQVLKDLENMSLVETSYLTNLNDVKLMMAGWVLDLNFAGSFTEMLNKNYLGLLKQTLPDEHIVKAIFNRLYSFAHSKI